MTRHPRNWREGLALTALAIVLGFACGGALYARLDDATRTTRAALRLVHHFFPPISPTNRP